MREADPSVVVERLARDVGNRTAGRLTVEAVEAVDVVSHALDYSKHPDGRRVWSEVVRRGEITAEAERAVVTMVHGLNEAVRGGDELTVLQICDCLATIFDSDTDSAHDSGEPALDRT